MGRKNLEANNQRQSVTQIINGITKEEIRAHLKGINKKDRDNKTSLVFKVLRSLAVHHDCLPEVELTVKEIAGKLTSKVADTKSALDLIKKILPKLTKQLQLEKRGLTYNLRVKTPNTPDQEPTSVEREIYTIVWKTNKFVSSVELAIPADPSTYTVNKQFSALEPNLSGKPNLELREGDTVLQVISRESNTKPRLIVNRKDSNNIKPLRENPDLLRHVEPRDLEHPAIKGLIEEFKDVLLNESYTEPQDDCEIAPDML